MLSRALRRLRDALEAAQVTEDLELEDDADFDADELGLDTEREE